MLLIQVILKDDITLAFQSGDTSVNEYYRLRPVL